MRLCDISLNILYKTSDHHTVCKRFRSLQKKSCKMEHLSRLLAILALLVFITPSMQFGFFDNMFGGGNPFQQQAQPQNMGSDSVWYQNQYENGTSILYLPNQLSPFPRGLDRRPQYASSMNNLLTRFISGYSALRQIPLPAHVVLRSFPAPLPVRIPGRGREG